MFCFDKQIMMYANIYLYYFSSSFEIERPTLISFVFFLLLLIFPVPCPRCSYFAFSCMTSELLHDLCLFPAPHLDRLLCCLIPRV